MAETNERLARVETQLDGQREMLARLDRHMETMSQAHAEMGAAVAQIPALIGQMQSVLSAAADQSARIAALEAEAAQSRKARHRLYDVIEPKVSRTYFITNATAWLAGVCLAAVITAAAKGWIDQGVPSP